MPLQQFLFTNALQIPNLFSAPFDVTFRLGFVIFSVMLIAAILHENLQALKGKSDFTGLFLRVLVVTALLVIYERFFVWVVYGMDLLSKSVLPENEFKEVLQAVFQDIGAKKDFGILKFLSIITTLNFITYAIALALLGVLTWLRFIFLALLYVIGPVLTGFAVYKATADGLAFWLRSLVAVSSWTFVLSILMKVISTMNLISVYLPKESNSAAVLAANLLFIILFISVPVISHQITRGGSLSGLGSAVVGIGTAFIAKFATRSMHHQNPSPASGAGTQGYKP
ncbi:MAG: hypothetical protein A2036_01780 [Omnitrophica bacterium GWA2_50_21]|nr:MAG: hypothetical protein A2036_01780 [Omnitrophica bacterium GWA2_50_21]